MIRSSLLFASVVLVCCTEEFKPDLKPIERHVIVSGWLDNVNATQEIKLTYSQPYFDSSLPQTVKDALVLVVVEDAELAAAQNLTGLYHFTESGSGIYTWEAGGMSALQGAGRSYMPR